MAGQGPHRAEPLTREDLEERFTAPDGIESLDDALRLTLAGGPHVEPTEAPEEPEAEE